MSLSESERLPISECLDELVERVRHAVPVVLKAPPGAGKTTGVPPALLNAGIANDGRILLIQPRRMAARAAAHRLAAQLGSQVGQEVGYHVRFDSCVSRQTRLIAMTTGVLLRRLSADPLLQDVSCVLLDEFHERSIEMDLALGMLQRIRTTLRPELKLVVMSATLDPQPLLHYFVDAVALESQGRSFPVDVEYTQTLSRDPIDQQVAAILPRVLQRTSGHVLIFLPGLGEIRRVQRGLESRGLGRDATILQLYGDLPPDSQDAVLAPSSTRKIVLSTNVAETSVTIPGVTAVIDSGTARVMQVDPRVGLPKLQLQSISQAAADQRAGRAGRTEPGICYRLWPAAVHRSRRPVDLPEIRRCDFSGSLLTLSSWGERDVLAFPWLTPPPEDAVVAAKTLLQRLDAIDGDDNLTEIGKEMMELPLSPRLARFMIEAARHDVVAEAAIAASLLSERDPFRGVAHDTHSSASGCDVTDRVERLQQAFRGTSSAAIHPQAVRQIQRAARQIEHQTRALRREIQSSRETDALAEDSLANRLKRSLLAAFPDRLARRRAADSDRGVLVGGRGVRLDRRSLARNADLFLCIEIDSQGAEATVTVASEIEASWLDPIHVREIDEPFFDASLSAVVARRRRYFLDLQLSESPIRCKCGPAVAQLLAAESRKDLSRVLPKKDDRLQEFIQQVRFLNRHLPQIDLPPLDSAAIDDVLVQLCQTRTSFAELGSAPWLDHLRGRYDYRQLKLIEEHAPSRITVPSGNAITVHYDDTKPPMMEVRIQEIFGWHQTPRVAGGRVAVQLHLLGPNYRPQQITDDLASFWNETYSQVRKELRRRYPKHHWPEDPRSAAASRNGLKPRSPDASV